MGRLVDTAEADEASLLRRRKSEGPLALCDMVRRGPARAARGDLTQEDVAFKANLHPTDIGNLEPGEREPKLSALAWCSQRETLYRSPL